MIRIKRWKSSREKYFTPSLKSQKITISRNLIFYIENEIKQVERLFDLGVDPKCVPNMSPFPLRHQILMSPNISTEPETLFLRILNP